jgi:hypothetical protein
VTPVLGRVRERLGQDLGDRTRCDEKAPYVL